MSTEARALTGKNNYFEDFTPGDVYEHARGKTVEGLENVLITNLVLNTAQAHFNEHLAESLPQGHRITFGGVTASIVIGLAMQDTGENALEELSLDKVRFRVPVLHGDTLYAFSEVVAKEENPSDARGYKDAGLVHFRHWGVNQRGETVFEGERRVLVKKRAFSTVGLELTEARAAVAPRDEPGAKRAVSKALKAARAKGKASHARASTPRRIRKGK
ncbi:MAG TPA: MaoC family dehydratase [Candidatus Binataceae bacterium]|nr:MaoC family dehydratase [Candidatus Binataceae bacterium]